MKKWIGIVMLVLSALLLFSGWAVWSEMGEEADALSGMRAVSAHQFADAHEGDRVVIAGKTVAPQPPLIAPVSKKPVAWYKLELKHHWQEKRQSCSKHHICHDYWANDHADLPSESSGTLDVRIADSKRVVHITIPKAKNAIARLYSHKSQRTPMQTKATSHHRKDAREVREFSLRPNATVTVAGTVHGSGDTRSIKQVAGTSLVYQASRKSMIKNLHGYQSVGIYTMIASLVCALGGILLVRSNRKSMESSRESGN